LSWSGAQTTLVDGAAALMPSSTVVAVGIWSGGPMQQLRWSSAGSFW
jgi:hypothetical protein